MTENIVVILVVTVVFFFAGRSLYRTLAGKGEGGGCGGACGGACQCGTVQLTDKNKQINDSNS